MRGSRLDAERALVSKAIATGQIEKLINAGIEDFHLRAPDVREVWLSAVKHVHKYRVAPSADAVAKLHPDFTFEVSSDSLDYLKDEFVKTAKRRAAIDG